MLHGVGWVYYSEWWIRNDVERSSCGCAPASPEIRNGRPRICIRSIMAWSQPARCKNLHRSKWAITPEHWMDAKELRTHVLNEPTTLPCLLFYHVPFSLNRGKPMWQHSQRQKRITCTPFGMCSGWYRHCKTRPESWRIPAPQKKKLPCVPISNFPVLRAQGKINALWRLQMIL